MTARAEVIGDPVTQSKSPLIHGYWLRLLGIDADYGRAHVRAGGLAGHLAAARGDPAWLGCNVTMPHKIAVMAHLDAVDPVAERVGAVNTVVRAGDRLVGHNTDVAGIAEPLARADRAIERDPGHVATYAQIVGAGGAARAAAVALGAAHDLEFYNRTADRAVAMARESGLPDAYGRALDRLGPVCGDGRYSHILVNASPMGMDGRPPVPVDLDAYPDDTIVFDMVYAPLKTPLLKAARARGLRTIDGLEMLVGQAAAAFALFFGIAPPRDPATEAELRARLLAS